MTAFVVDTNVCIVANGDAEHADVSCQQACIRKLLQIKEHGLLVVDSGGHIFSEYNNRLTLAGQPGVGDMFFKWLFNHQHAGNLIEIVDLPKTGDEFDGFPDDPRLARFDRKDRMFVAAALTYNRKHRRKRAHVQNAVDRDWWNHREPLKENGVAVDFLCGTERFARTKKRKRS